MANILMVCETMEIAVANGTARMQVLQLRKMSGQRNQRPGAQLHSFASTAVLRSSKSRLRDIACLYHRSKDLTGCQVPIITPTWVEG
jgi:hypothetical protein